MKGIYLTILCVIAFFSTALAQGVEMADNLRGSGKIYVVVAVISVIFLGLILFLASIDRKVRQLEKQQQTNK